jgi:hypothetical protein
LGKIIQQLISPTFEASHTKTYELSILVGVDSFGFAILSDQQRLLALRQYSLEDRPLDADMLEQLHRKDELLSASFRNIRLAFATPRQVIVPDRLYNPDDHLTYLEGTTRLSDRDTVLADQVASLHTCFVYAVEDSLEAAARRLFSGCRIFHLGHVLLEGQRRLVNHKDGAYFHLLDGHLFASVLQNGALAFFNAYRYRSAKDFVYYAMLVFEQAGLSAESTRVYLSGQLVEASEIYRLLARYLPLMEFMDTRAIFKFDLENDREVAYQYFDLLSLSLL